MPAASGQKPGEIIVDGTVDFSGGVDSLSVPTIASALNPNGLQRNETAWLDNCTVRDGGISQRPGWQYKGRIHDGSALWQGGFMYDPLGANPYLMVSIGGHIIQTDPDFSIPPVDLSVQFNLFNPPTEPHAYLCQGEEFLIIQAGDNVTLPLFWDGTTLRRSIGIVGVQATGTTTGPVTFNVTTTAAFTVPAVGSNVQVQLQNAPQSDLFKTFLLKNITGMITIGLFQCIGVESVAPVSETWQCLSSALVGTGFPPQILIATLTSPASFTSALWGPYTLTVPAIAAALFIRLDTAEYPGNVGDHVHITTSTGLDLSNWEVTNFRQGLKFPDGSWRMVPTLTVVNIDCGLAGTTIPNTDTLTFTITAPYTTTPTGPVNELPAATAMDYFMGRLWYVNGRTYSAGDIVANHDSGTAPYKWRDSILKVTENPLCFGGDGFTVPTQAGNIRALFHNANLNTQLGQGQLLIGTRKAIYTITVPQSRQDWINANANNQPIQTVAQLVNGPVNDRSIVRVNGDVFYQTLEPAISSLIWAIRDFQQWSNRALSSNEDRILSFNDRSLLLESSGIAFDNRMLQTALPKQVAQGVVHQALVPLDFMPISNFNAQTTQTQPVWEGMYEGLDILQLFTGDFGGLERAFAVTVSRDDGGIDLWELTDYLRSDFQKPTATSDGEARVTWIVETPAFNWAREFDLKRLETLELWIDKLYGEVIFKVEWRSDSDPCWRLWKQWKECQPRTSCETPEGPCYPLTQYREGFRATMTLPVPPTDCGSNTGRPACVCYQAQLRITVKGWARIRGLLLHATVVERELFKNLVC